MVRTTEKEMVAMEKIICYSQVQRGEGMLRHTGPHREAPGMVWKQVARGKCGQEPLLWFILEGTGRAG